MQSISRPRFSGNRIWGNDAVGSPQPARSEAKRPERFLGFCFSYYRSSARLAANAGICYPEVFRAEKGRYLLCEDEYVPDFLLLLPGQKWCDVFSGLGPSVGCGLCFRARLEVKSGLVLEKKFRSSRTTRQNRFWRCLGVLGIFCIPP